ncbi:hypothetical protein ABPG73_003620 [Tetrahymena malaccensis]
MLLQEGFFFSYQTRLEGVSSGNSILKSQILNFLNYNQNSYQKKQPEQDMQSNLKRFQSMSSCQCLYKMEGTLMKDLVKQTKKPKYEKKRKKTTNCYIVLHRTNNYELENEKLVKLFNMFDNLRRNLFQDLIKVHSEVAVFICQHIIKLARTTIFCAFQLNTMSADLGNMRTAFDEQSIMKVRTLMEVESKKFINQRAESQNQILSLTYLMFFIFLSSSRTIQKNFQLLTKFFQSFTDSNHLLQLLKYLKITSCSQLQLHYQKKLLFVIILKGLDCWCVYQNLTTSYCS